MQMYENAEIRKGTHVARVNVGIQFDQVSLSKPETVEWSGMLLPPNNTGLMVGQEYSVRIPGHSPARIVITDEVHPVDFTVPFKGISEQPVTQTLQDTRSNK